MNVYSIRRDKENYKTAVQNSRMKVEILRAHTADFWQKFSRLQFGLRAQNYCLLLYIKNSRFNLLNYLLHYVI